jgi:class 3 adenylate cyclase
MNTSPTLENRLRESGRIRFLREYFGNTAWFPIANVLLEALLEGPLEYLLKPDLYAMLGASLVQAWVLSRWPAPRRGLRLLGNLVGPAVYTLGEMALEGLSFWSSPNHIAYWAFALAVGLLQELRPRRPMLWQSVCVVAEDVVRTSILLAMYMFFEFKSDPAANYNAASFISDASHRFVALVIPLLGLSLGLANLTAQRYLGLLQETSGRLKTYAEWLLGRTFLARLVENPNALALMRHERTVLFMDVRSFTQWSEQRTPEEVVTLLNEYYALAEEVLNAAQAVKFKFSADEVMAVFATPQQALQAARTLREQAGAVLGRANLGAGIGLHTGQLVEGLLGSRGVKFYDVIGDTVNTAKRIEGAAAAGEILCTEAVRQALAEQTFDPPRTVMVKGKEKPLAVYRLQEKTTDALTTPPAA